MSIELTPNLGLKKPDGTEKVSLSQHNENMDKIDAVVSTKAAYADVFSGVDGQKYVNPKVLNGVIKNTTKLRTVEITTSSSWVCPDGVYSVDVLIVGAGQGGKGGSGGPDTRTIGNGGNGGVALFRKNIAVTPGTSYPIVIGSGGNGGAGGGYNVVGAAGGTGGSSSAFGLTAAGGSPTAYENTAGNYGGNVTTMTGTGKLTSVVNLWPTYSDIPYGCGGGNGGGNGSAGTVGGGTNGGAGATWGGVAAVAGGKGSGGGGGSGSQTSPYKGNGAAGGYGGGGGGGGGYGVYSTDTYGGNGGNGGNGLAIIYY